MTLENDNKLKRRIPTMISAAKAIIILSLALLFTYMRLGHNYFIFITNKASLWEYDILVKDNHPRQQTST
jgi:hypothetical protein